MATKKMDKEITLEAVKQTLLRTELIGTSDLILNKKCRSYERMEVWKQTNPKGAKIPKELDQDYCLWEHLLTSITWENPITYHDDNYQLYTEDEWKYQMENNHPCILTAAFAKAMGQTFKTFGYKSSTGKDGTDLKRSVVFTQSKCPISFSSVTYEQKLVPTTGLRSTNVVAQYNVFSGWRCNIEIACADIVFPIETIIDILASTGKFLGVGTQRTNGYGRWEIGEVKVTELA